MSESKMEVAGAPPKRCAMAKPADQETAPAQPPLPAVRDCIPRRAPMLAVTSTAAHSIGTQNSIPRRSNIEECLPPDVLETVLQFLDRETLCTTRLVSKTFCSAASANISSLTCRITSPRLCRQRFPRLGRVTVCDSYQGEKIAQLDPCLWDLFTTVSLTRRYESASLVSITATRAQVPLLPKLQALDLRCDVAALLRLCTNLESIRLLHLPLDYPLPSLATSIACMTRLTELAIDQSSSSKACRKEGLSWLQPVTALKNLQALEIYTPSEALPLIANLTGLTGLTWCESRFAVLTFSLDPLTRLTLLRSLNRSGCKMSDSNADVACSLGSGSMVNLELWASQWCGEYLTRQTALTRLSLTGGVCNSRHNGALRLDLLQSLQLQALRPALGFSALCKATSLTELHLQFHGRALDDEEGPAQEEDDRTGQTDLPTLRPLRFSQVLAGLTQLRCLQLKGVSTVKLFNFSLGLRPLTGLTHLVISRGGLDDGDLRALLVLTGLRVLDLFDNCLTDEVVPELSALTNLRTLKVNTRGNLQVTPESVTKVLNPLRHARGWPPMEC